MFEGRAHDYSLSEAVSPAPVGEQQLFMGRFSWALIDSLFAYDKVTGRVTNKVDRARRHGARKGAVIGGAHPNPDNYLTVTIQGATTPLHTLIWFLVTGECPTLVIDHKNRIKADNRWSNLRLATDSQNNANRALSRINTTGYRCVLWVETKRLWRVRWKLNGRKMSGGYFKCEHAAALAYNRLAHEAFGDFAMLNEVPFEHVL